MNRKAALVGCESGNWVRTAGMRKLRLYTRMPEGTELTIHQCDGSGNLKSITVASGGRHNLIESDWVRVVVSKGKPAGVLCLLESPSSEAA